VIDRLRGVTMSVFILPLLLLMKGRPRRTAGAAPSALALEAQGAH
jgi:hypothetical protein